MMTHSTLCIHTFVYVLLLLHYLLLFDLRNTFVFLSQKEIKQYISYH